MPSPILVTVFNHKGGVGKTSACYNIGYVLAEELGIKVLLVDADPQCNLTGLIMHDTFQKDANAAEKFYRECQEKEQKNSELITLGDCFRPLTERKEQIGLDRADKVLISPVQDYKNLFFIPGHLSVSNMDEHVTLGIAGLGLYENVPGIVCNFFRRVAEKNDIQMVIFDLSPNLGGFNQALIMGSGYFISPYFADFFSFQAIQSLAQKFPQWKNKEFQRFRNKSPEDPGYIPANPMFLGAFPQRAQIRKKSKGDEKKVDALVESYAYWINRINEQVKNFIEILRKNGMLSQRFSFIDDLAGIREFNSIGLDVQSSGRPIADTKHKTPHQTDGHRVTYRSQDAAKQAINLAYKRVIGALFKNLKLEDLDQLGKDFKERILLFVEINEQVHLSGVESPRTPLSNYVEDQIATNSSWYTNKRIGQLLKHYLKDLPDIHLFEAQTIVDARNETVSEQLNKQLNQQETNLRSPDRWLIPINLNPTENHWILVYIRFTRATESPVSAQPDIYYYDRVGSAIPDRISNALKKIFPDSDVVTLGMHSQSDDAIGNLNCGAWVVEAGKALGMTGSLRTISLLDIKVQCAEHSGIISAMEHGATHNLRRRRATTTRDSLPAQSYHNVRRDVPQIPGLQYEEVPGDGHCLFHAVGLHLGRDQQTLRKEVADYIQRNIDEFNEIISTLNPGRTPDEYIRAVREGREWADNLEMAVLMKVYNRPIFVIETNGRIRNTVSENFNGEPIFVHYNGHNHYNAFILTRNANSRNILNNLQSSSNTINSNNQSVTSSRDNRGSSVISNFFSPLSNTNKRSHRNPRDTDSDEDEARKQRRTNNVEDMETELDFDR